MNPLIVLIDRTMRVLLSLIYPNEDSWADSINIGHDTLDIRHQSGLNHCAAERRVGVNDQTCGICRIRSVTVTLRDSLRYVSRIEL